MSHHPHRATLHALDRAQERLGRELTPEIGARIVREIKRALRRRNCSHREGIVAHPLETRDPTKIWRITRWRVDIDGVCWRVAYDADDRRIITVLPPYEAEAKRTP